MANQQSDSGALSSPPPPPTAPRSLRNFSGYLSGLVHGRLWLKVLVGMVLGLLVGILLGPSVGLVRPETGAALGSWLAFPGQLFLATIQMIVVPLVIASVIRGLTASEDIDQLKKLGIRVISFFVVTTAIAAAIGLWVGGFINPGAMLSGLTVPAAPTTAAPTPESPLNLVELPQAVLGLLPGNPLGAMVEGQMLQVVIFSSIIGVALITLSPEKARPMLDLLDSLQQICMTVVSWAMRLAPIAVFGLMAQLTTSIGVQAMLGMAYYVFTVLLGLALMFGLYLLILLLIGGYSPRLFLRQSRDVLLLAFSTSSSAAVMPLSIRTAEDRLGVRSSISQFVVPLGATINMTGTALYQSVATVFLAQVYGIELGMASMALVVAMAVGASIGSPATPGVGIVILAMVLQSVGVPAAGIALIMGVDRILDMCRTMINVTGDLVASRLLENWAGRRLPDVPAARPGDP